MTCPIAATKEYLLLGFSSPLSKNYLPTYKDILRYSYYLREEEATTGKPQLKKYTDILSKLQEDLEDVWKKASIPEILDKYVIRNKLKILQNEYEKIKQCIQSKRSPEAVNKFEVKLKQLFDICSCKCPTDDIHKF